MYQILSVIVITIAFVFYSRASSRDTTSARQKGCAFALTTYSVTSFSLSLSFFFLTAREHLIHVSLSSSLPLFSPLPSLTVAKALLGV